ncbi:MAG TPA: MXAN_2755 family glutamic-type intramembrane protease [Anaeromyxobacteraceae bacterium]|nr:MXAN_2755 family glutamic-type intramembrane protease [Anaeromyxobacteraceae bacterium]
MSLVLARAAPARARRELVLTWLACIGLLAAARAVALVDPTGLLASNLAGVAAFLFIVLPERKIHARGERWTAYGLPWSGVSSPATWAAWGRGLVQAAAVAAVVFPLFLLAFWAYGRILPHLPRAVAEHLAPYLAPPAFRLRAPARLPLLVAVQLLVVALPEELFYRGWMQTTWAASHPERGVRVLGARLGAGFLVTQALFAAGHLVVFQAWRLGTFFPALLFGWLRERTAGLAAPVFLHALSNLFLATLEASFYG